MAIFPALLICLLMITRAFSEDTVIALNLHKVYFVEGPDNFQPSGLTIIDGRLYTVSDKHDHLIYRLKLNSVTAAAIPAVKIPLPILSFIHPYDFEGITHDDSGNFYLASETQCRILRISPDGENADWITPDLKPAGEKAGLFQVKNAYLEGICCISSNEFILCTERQSRGFVEINLAATPIQINAYPSEYSKFEFPEGKRKDFSGLCRYKNDLYILERNAFLISQLKRDNNKLVETIGWSYRHIETITPYRYVDMEFGKAEGLCMDDDYIYIIFDNNGDHRADTPDDCRPLLMLFNHPDNL
ncbi:MAG: hypothetical protein HF978_20370 [Desulfobacteraceae bacterium]|nr:hypothetical protein [Desulfobacteraceae bacterium]MBC2757904.1 hypothetical protein [Desulfobacteraceae bacterium]